MTKVCTKCKQDLPISMYARDKRNLNGLQSSCNECKTKQKREARERIRQGIGVKDVTHKKCTQCSQVKEVVEFYKDSGLSDGYAVKCKECKDKTTAKWREENRTENNIIAKRYRINNPEKYKNAVLKSLYGLTLEQYQQMKIEQGGKCKICKRIPKKLMVDHNHATGEVRGLLCHGCNRGIAIMDNAEYYASAKQYLKLT